MGLRPLTIEEVRQVLTDPKFLEDLELDPEYVRKWAISNLITRTLAHLVGQGFTKAIPIRATQDGALIVATTGTAVQRYEPYIVTFTDDDPDTITFTHTCSFVEFWISLNAVLLRHTFDGTTWGGWIELPAGSYWCCNATCKAVEIKNAAATENAKYQIVGWY